MQPEHRAQPGSQSGGWGSGQPTGQPTGQPARVVFLWVCLAFVDT